MVEPTFRGGDVALFIDWENFKISLAAGNRTPNLSSLREEVSEQGRVVVAKAYADWVTRAPELRGASQFINDPPSLYAAGIEPVFVPTRVPSSAASTANGMRTYRVKNSVDVKMTADCIECAHSYPNIGTFVLVSGDSDFLHVVNALRSMGKRVVIIGVSWSTSRQLSDQVDSLLLYDKDVDPPPAPANPQPAVLPQHAARRPAAAPPPNNEAPELAEVIRAIEDIIRDERAAGGNPLLTSIKQRLMRRYPAFDEKKLGFSGFKKLMARAAEDGNIKLIHAGLVDWAIMASEETPEGTIEESPSGVAAKSGRRRGGRRRHATPGGGEDPADTPPTPPDAAPLYADSPEETAATDYLGPGAAPPDAADAIGEPADAADALADDPGDAAAEDPFGNDAALAGAVRESLAAAALPADPDDGQHPQRVSDLVVMADTLEHRQGVSHVAFNFLVAEICGALEQGLAAGNAEIAGRWAGVISRDYVGRMLRGLREGEFFRQATHTWRDEASGRRRQRRTFNLNRDNALVGRMLAARLGPAANGGPPGAESAAAEVESAADETAADAAAMETETETQSVDVGVDNVVADAVAGDGNGVTAAPGQPALPMVDDEILDEPQPRTVRRRPFTSRLLRS